MAKQLEVFSRFGVWILVLTYVETPPFAVPRKRPEILLATPRRPLLFAQGFPREEGRSPGSQSCGWPTGRRHRGLFSMRSPPGRNAQLGVRVIDSKGAVTVQHLGRLVDKSERDRDTSRARP